MSDCENVINTTPQLRYVPTKLEYSFRSLEKIEREIGNFGKLNTLPIGTGDVCVFASTTAATKAPAASPKAIDMDSVLVLQLKNSTFDPKAKKVKLSFKVNKRGTIPGIENVEDCLKIHVFCAEDEEDQKGEDMAPIHQETVDFSTCKRMNSVFVRKIANNTHYICIYIHIQR